MPGASSRPALYNDFDDDRTNNADQNDRDRDTTSSSKEDKQEGSKGDKSDKEKKGSGWLGGILTKLSLRAPNQMILPDDKNPSIVWDEATKRWVNRDAPERGGDAPPPPPPKAIPTTSTPLQSPGGSGLVPGVPGAAGGNMLRMQRGRNIKKSYVDVFNPGGSAASAPPPAPLAPLAPAPTATPAYFVPPPVNQSGIYDPSQMEPERSAI
ncbi:unnamed protein product [Colias eurytheme]|nr:unnamed protein product [Colias eurytheme]